MREGEGDVVDIVNLPQQVNDVNNVPLCTPVLVLQSTYFNNEFKRVSLQPGMTTPFMDAIAASVPRSHVKVVRNVGHFSMIEAAGIVSEEIGKFAAAVA